MPPYLARLVEAGRAEPVLPCQLGDRHAAFSLLDEPDDLFGSESALAHVRPLQVNGLYLLLVGTADGGAGHTLSRTGHAAARRALYMPGLVAKRHNPVIVAMAQRLQQRGLAPKAIVGASMRKLIHLIYGVLKSGQAFNADIPMRGLAIQDGI